MLSVPSCQVSTSHITRTLARTPPLRQNTPSTSCRRTLTRYGRPSPHDLSPSPECCTGTADQARLLDEAPRTRGANAQGSRRLTDSARRPGPEEEERRPRRAIRAPPSAEHSRRGDLVVAEATARENTPRRRSTTRRWPLLAVLLSEATARRTPPRRLRAKAERATRRRRARGWSNKRASTTSRVRTRQTQ
jgi:hypothetical protein